jgi:tetratricopeptide (TPR) repeat protein
VAPRTRALVIVAAVSVAAAGAAVGGALVQGRDVGGEVHGLTETRPEGPPEPPALELAVLAPGADAERLRAAERAYEEDEAEKALELFAAALEEEPGSVEAAVGAAVAEDPLTASERLRAIVREHPSSGVARLNLGLALLSEGNVESARREWREAKRRDPDSPAALRAEDLLNPRSPPGRPSFHAPLRLDERLVGAVARGEAAPLREATRAAHARDTRGFMRLGLAYQALGRRLSAQRAFEEAARVAPDDLTARTAAAVARFDKDDPSAAFSRLGPLAARNPAAAVVRFHIGLALLWLPDVAAARRQLALARRVGGNGFYGREAGRVLAGLADVE